MRHKSINQDLHIKHKYLYIRNFYFFTVYGTSTIFAYLTSDFYIYNVIWGADLDSLPDYATIWYCWKMCIIWRFLLQFLIKGLKTLNWGFRPRAEAFQQSAPPPQTRRSAPSKRGSLVFRGRNNKFLPPKDVGCPHQSSKDKMSTRPPATRLSRKRATTPSFAKCVASSTSSRPSASRNWATSSCAPNYPLQLSWRASSSWSLKR